MRFARFDLDGWELEDGEARHAEAPATFEIPDKLETGFLVPGQIVKLMFRIALGDDIAHSREVTERMWVLVDSCNDDGYVGTLDNDARSTARICAGLKIRFVSQHVIQIWRETDRR